MMMQDDGPKVSGEDKEYNSLVADFGDFVDTLARSAKNGGRRTQSV